MDSGQNIRHKKFIDPETGEVVSGMEIYEAVSHEVSPQTRFDWVKLYPRLLSRLQEVLKSKSFDVIVFCLERTKYGTNEFRGSRSEIAKATGVGPATVNRVFEGLISHDLIRPVVGSTWMVNPRIIHGGSQAMDVVLWRKYCELAASDKARRKKLDAQYGTEPSKLENLINEIAEGDYSDDNL